jgi:orotidine-5'-phosphate decarboxylase
VRASAREKIIVPLDFDTHDKAIACIHELYFKVGTFKVGHELISAGLAHDVVHWAWRVEQRPVVFWDGKLKDIPNTVARACGILCRYGITMMNVHAKGGAEMMRAAVRAVADEHRRLWPDPDVPNPPPRPKVLAVTLLTSLGFDDLVETGEFSLVEQTNGDHEAQIRQRVLDLARLAQDCGVDGVIASPREIKAIREACGGGFLIVTPGVRPEWAAKNDQARVMTPFEAVSEGADYLVIGRPITDPPNEVGSMVQAAELIADEIAQALGA